MLDRPITKEEIKKSLDALQKDKTPGISGLTKEFYSFFWDEIGDFYHEVVNEIYDKEELTNSQKKGVIKISYKKNGRHLIKNYRPITLLNTDLKLITKTLATRLAKVIQNIVHESQKCVPGRRIIENIHLVQDLIDAIVKRRLCSSFHLIRSGKSFR